MIKLRHVLLVGALLGLSTASAQAAYVGALTLYGTGPTSSASTPGASTWFATTDNTPGSIPASGIFTGATTGDLFGGTYVDITLLSPVNAGGFSLSNATYGTFTGTAGSVYSTSANSVTLAITGTFTGGTANPGSSTFLAYLNYLKVPGGDPVQQITLVVPAVPEPSSVALGSIGLVSLGLVALRKRLAK